jgi:hypothetical protein
MNTIILPAAMRRSMCHTEPPEGNSRSIIHKPRPAFRSCTTTIAMSLIYWGQSDSAMRSFFSLLQKDLLNERRWAIRGGPPPLSCGIQRCPVEDQPAVHDLPVLDPEPLARGAFSTSVVCRSYIISAVWSSPNAAIMLARVSICARDARNRPVPLGALDAAGRRFAHDVVCDEGYSAIL